MPEAARAALGSGDGTGYVDDDGEEYEEEYDDSEESIEHVASNRRGPNDMEVIKYAEVEEPEDS
jgi:hypothetical protein